MAEIAERRKAESSETRKIILESIDQELNAWRVWDNGDVDNRSSSDDLWSSNYVGNGRDREIWLSVLKQLVPGKVYRFRTWRSSNLEACFSDENDIFGVRAKFYGFEDPKCKECGSDNIKNNICHNCGEWQ